MAHIHEKIDFTATVYVVHNDTVLLRLHDKYGEWFGVGGHIELDEDANAAALREVKEEVGLDVTLVSPQGWTKYGGSMSGRELIPPLFLNIHPVSTTHQHHDLVFAAQSNTDAVIPEQPGEKWLWLTEEELLAHPHIGDHVKFHARAALLTVRRQNT